MAVTRKPSRTEASSTRGPRTSGLRIIVLGYLVKGPLAGFAWHHLQYVMGLLALGHDVYFVEDSGDSRWCCYDPSRCVTDADPTYGLKFATDAFALLGLGDRWAYYDFHTNQWHGPCAENVLKVCATADVLLNLGQTNPLRPWLVDIPVRALVDTDPGFTQIRILTEPERRSRALQHTVFFSFGENIGLAGCTVPDAGLPWVATRQPVVLDAWPLTAGPTEGSFSTIMQWDSYPPREYEGQYYGMKSDSFGPYTGLPERSSAKFDIALGGNAAPRSQLRAKGWKLSDPVQHTRDLAAYQRYIQHSKGEFSVAKHGYVVSRSGWFSERSAAYLASGRPIVVQDTGFTDWLPSGAGVAAFRNPDEALAGIDAIGRQYAVHCRAAREIAEEYFDARKVLARLVEMAMNRRSVLVATVNPTHVEQ